MAKKIDGLKYSFKLDYPLFGIKNGKLVQLKNDKEININDMEDEEKVRCFYGYPKIFNYL